MKTLIQEWEVLKETKDNENIQFLTALKFRAAKNLQQKVDAIHDAVFEEINCLDCGNCCKTYTVTLTEEDYQRIEARVGTAFMNNLDIVQEPNDNWIIRSVPCPFLGINNICSIYEIRPEECASYPHLKGKDIRRRRYMHVDNAKHCPAAFHVLERIKKRMKM